MSAAAGAAEEEENQYTDGRKYSHSQTSFNHLSKFTTANKLLVNDKFCIKYGIKKEKTNG